MREKDNNTDRETKKSIISEGKEAVAFTFEPITGRHVPQTYKVARQYLTQAPQVENLFSKLMERELGKDGGESYLISGLDTISKTDFAYFTLAAQQILYNQSYLCGNEDTNSGISREIASKTRALLGDSIDHHLFSGEIIFTLNELCRLMYGEPQPQSIIRKRVENMIKTLHKEPIKVTWANGDTTETYICNIRRRDYRKKDGAVAYRLWLSPIFTENVKRNFAELPQDALPRLMDSLKKNKIQRTFAGAQLLKLLSCQDKRKPYKVGLDKLLNTLDRMEAFKKNKTRTIKDLWKLFKVMEDIGIITGLPREIDLADGTRGFVFRLNPNFVRPKDEESPNPISEDESSVNG